MLCLCIRPNDVDRRIIIIIIMTTMNNIVWTNFDDDNGKTQTHTHLTKFSWLPHTHTHISQESENRRETISL